MELRYMEIAANGRNVLWTMDLPRCRSGLHRCLLNQFLTCCFSYLPMFLMDICFVCVTHPVPSHSSSCFGIKSKLNKGSNILEDQVDVRSLSCQVSLSLMFFVCFSCSSEPVCSFWWNPLRPWFFFWGITVKCFWTRITENSLYDVRFVISVASEQDENGAITSRFICCVFRGDIFKLRLIQPDPDQKP